MLVKRERLWFCFQNFFGKTENSCSDQNDFTNVFKMTGIKKRFVYLIPYDCKMLAKASITFYTVHHVLLYPRITSIYSLSLVTLQCNNTTSGTIFWVYRLFLLILQPTALRSVPRVQLKNFKHPTITSIYIT